MQPTRLVKLVISERRYRLPGILYDPDAGVLLLDAQSRDGGLTVIGKHHVDIPQLLKQVSGPADERQIRPRPTGRKQICSGSAGT